MFAVTQFAQRDAGVLGEHTRQRSLQLRALGGAKRAGAETAFQLGPVAGQRSHGRAARPRGRAESAATAASTATVRPVTS